MKVFLYNNKKNKKKIYMNSLFNLPIYHHLEEEGIKR